MTISGALVCASFRQYWPERWWSLLLSCKRDFVNVMELVTACALYPCRSSRHRPQSSPLCANGYIQTSWSACPSMYCMSHDWQCIELMIASALKLCAPPISLLTGLESGAETLLCTSNFIALYTSQGVTRQVEVAWLFTEKWSCSFVEASSICTMTVNIANDEVHGPPFIRMASQLFWLAIVSCLLA